jgi:GNAT superfamily N-acetyltransferase
MPANPRSIKVTERYRAGMVKLRRTGQAEAKRVWQRVNPDDIDGTFDVGRLAISVAALQKEATRLSSAYLASYLTSELGEETRPPPLMVQTTTFNDNPLREGLRSAAIKAKIRIGEGMEPRVAVKASRATLIADVGLFIDTSARESLRQGMEDDERIEGYHRAIRGTCGACAGMSDGSTLPAGTPLEIHPDCQCVSEPKLTPQSQAQILNARALVQVPADLAEKSIFQWFKKDRMRAYGMDIEELGDAVSGGYNFNMVARDASGKVMGRLEVQSAGEEGTIGMIEVMEGARRQGVATKLLDYFRRYNPDMTLDWGYTTPEGAALRASLPKEWQ